MIAYYRQEAVQVFFGFKQLPLTNGEVSAKKKADSIEMDTAYSMITEYDENIYKCKSFESDDYYDVVVSDSGYVFSCSCPVVNGICKHMFLLSRVKILPYSVPASTSSLRSSTSSSTSSSSYQNDNGSNIQLKELCDQVTVLQRNLNRTIQSVITNSSDNKVKLDKLRDCLKMCENSIADIDNDKIYSSKQV
ncbi:unnamed protein product [Absidia cylindrospora]